MLTKEANNALLKTLEEPPSHLIIILATTEPRKLLPTIISRCQHYRFQLPEPPQLVEAMRRVATSQELQISDDGLLLLAELAHGSYRDALGLLERLALRSQSGQSLDREAVLQELGLPELQLVDQLLDLMTETDSKSKDLVTWWKAIDSYRQRGGQLNELLEASLTQLERRLVAGQRVPASLVGRILQANRLKQGLPLGHDWLVLHYLLNDTSPETADTKPVVSSASTRPVPTVSAIQPDQPTTKTTPILEVVESAPPLATPTVAAQSALTPLEFKEVLTQLLQQSELPKTVLTILKSAQFLSFTPPKLELSVGFELHKVRLSQPTIRQQLEQELSTLLAQPIAVVLTVQKSELDLASQAEALLGGSGL